MGNNGLSIYAIFDTGATKSIIEFETFKKICTTSPTLMYPSEYSVRLPTNNSSCSVEGVCSLNITFRDIHNRKLTISSSFLVVSDLREKIYIGLDFIHKYVNFITHEYVVLTEGTSTTRTPSLPQDLKNDFIVKFQKQRHHSCASLNSLPAIKKTEGQITNELERVVEIYSLSADEKDNFQQSYFSTGKAFIPAEKYIDPKLQLDGIKKSKASF